jgi:hypothetical protein
MTGIRLKDDEVKEGLGWFSRQREGQAFFAALRSELMSIGPGETCALHENRGRRILAAELLQMAVSDAPESGNDRVERQSKRTNRPSRRAGPAGRVV